MMSVRTDSDSRGSRGGSFTLPALGGVKSRPRQECPASVDREDEDEDGPDQHTGRRQFEPRSLLADWADAAEKTADDHRERASSMKKLNLFFNLSIVTLSSASIIVSNSMLQAPKEMGDFVWPLTLSIIGATIAIMRAAESSFQPMDKQGRHRSAEGEYDYIAKDIKTSIYNNFYSYKNAKHAVRLFRARLAHADDTTVAI